MARTRSGPEDYGRPLRRFLLGILILFLVAGLVTVTLWGSSFVAIRDAGQRLSPGSLALDSVVHVNSESAAAFIDARFAPPMSDWMIDFAYSEISDGLSSPAS